MLDIIENQISKKLANRHLYPFAQHIYLNIFRAFSHFPVNLSDIQIKASGKSITFMALVVATCMEQNQTDFKKLFDTVYDLMSSQIQKLVPQDVKVETLLGCILYYFHPVDVKNVLSEKHILKLLSENDLYEYDLKKKTILLHLV